MNTMIGNQLGKYQLTRMLGQGGMAEVYEAFQPGTERSVAIKVLRGYGNETPESVIRFKREARSIAQLRHNNIVQVFDFDVHENLYYMVMEYVRGGTLSEYIKSRGSLSTEEALHITIQLADALAYAHKNGVIHRDIKPVNILFTDAEHSHPVLTDFGIARVLGETSLTADGRFMGSPAYLSPEIALGHPADARSDIYSLGLTLYEMLAGRMPYNADDATGLVMQHMNAPLPSVRSHNPNVPLLVELVMSKALAKTRDQRYQSAKEFKGVLLRLVDTLASLKATAEAKTQNGSNKVTIDALLTPAFDSANFTGEPAQAYSSANPLLTPDFNSPDFPFDWLQTMPANGFTSNPVLTPAFDSPAYISESVPAELYQTASLPFDETPRINSSDHITEAIETEAPKSKRRRPLLALLAVLLLAGFGGYAVVNGGFIPPDPTETEQPAAILPGSSETPTDEPATATLTSTSTPSETSTITPTYTPSATSTATPFNPPVRQNGLSTKPTLAPSLTPSSTPTIRPTDRPAPTQIPNQQVNPTTAPAENPPPGDGGSGDGGNNNGGGGSDGGVVDGVVDTVVDQVVAPVVQPVQDIVEEVLPGLPCIINCP